MNKQYIPKQSHGIKTEIEVWVPPDLGPFMSADQKDEYWMRPLCMKGDRGQWGKLTKGIGLAPLYDVMDEEGEVIGFCELNPVLHWDIKSFIVVETFEDCSEITEQGFFKADSYLYQCFGKGQKCSQMLSIVRYGPNLSMIWKCLLSDAYELIRCGFLKHSTLSNSRFSSRLADRSHYRRLRKYGN